VSTFDGHNAKQMVPVVEIVDFLMPVSQAVYGRGRGCCPSPMKALPRTSIFPRIKGVLTSPAYQQQLNGLCCHLGKVANTAQNCSWVHAGDCLA